MAVFSRCLGRKRRSEGDVKVLYDLYSSAPAAGRPLTRYAPPDIDRVRDSEITNAIRHNALGNG